MIIFTKPQFLVFLLVIPLLIFFNIISIKMSKKKAIKFANFEAISRIKGVDIFSKNLTILYIHCFIVISVILAISGITLVRTVDTSAVSFVLAIDSSRSMASTDILPSRFEAAQKAALTFIDLLPEGSRLGIVSFSGSATIDQDITSDKSLAKGAVSNLFIKEVGGTDIYSALITSSNILKNELAGSIILVSDGSLNLNLVQNIVDYVQKNEIIVYALGVGTNEGGKDDSGGYYKISEENLRLISENSGGKYYNIQASEDFYNSINDIISTSKKSAVQDLSFYFLIAALVLFILEFILINTRYRTFP